MTDNLKTRIAEAIANGLGEKNSIDAIAKAVLDIMQPMLDGLQGVIDSQTQTNQALIKRIDSQYVKGLVEALKTIKSSKLSMAIEIEHICEDALQQLPEDLR